MAKTRSKADGKAAEPVTTPETAESAAAESTDKPGAEDPIPVPRARARAGRPRVVTVEVAEEFAKAMLSDVTHSVTSAAHAVGVHPKTVLDCLNRFERGESESEVDEEVGAILSAARAEHVRELRRKGELASDDANGPGVAWVKWRLETGAPKEHPRTTATSVELTGKDGGAIQVAARPMTRAEALAALKDDPEVVALLRGMAGEAKGLLGTGDGGEDGER